MRSAGLISIVMTGLLDGIADELQPELTPALMGILALVTRDKETSEQLCRPPHGQGSGGEARHMDVDGEGQARSDGTAEWDGRCDPEVLAWLGASNALEMFILPQTLT